MNIKDTIEQSKKIRLLKDNPTVKQVAEIVVSEKLNPIIDEINDQHKKIESELLELKKDLQEIELTPGETGDQGIKGEDGKTPIPGVDFPLPKDGKDYILTETDKIDIACKIEIPIVEKIIEKTEVIKEIPIVTNEIKEIAKYEAPLEIAKKLNTLTEEVEMSVIKGLEKTFDTVNRNIQGIKRLKGGGGGGSIDVYDDGVLITTRTRSIDFTGGITVSSNANGDVTADFSVFVLKAGDTMTGSLTIQNGATTTSAYIYNFSSITGSTLASDVAPTNYTITAQNPFATATVNRVGADLILNAGTGVGVSTTARDGKVHINGFQFRTERLLNWGNTAGSALTTDYGAVMLFTSSGADATRRIGLSVNLSGTYTGSEFTEALGFDNTSDGTSVTYTSDTSTFGYRPSGDRGIFGGARSVSAGIKSGLVALAGGSNNENYGVWGAATITRTSGINIGVFGAAANVAGPEFAGAFVLGTRSTQPVSRASSAALLCDNAELAEDIFAALDGGVDVFTITNPGYWEFTPTAATSGISNYFIFTGPTDTGLTASTEAIGWTWATSTNKTWAAGNITTQREYVFGNPTYTISGGASTITTAATLTIVNAPTAGTGTTITTPLALWIQAGNTYMADSLAIGNDEFSMTIAGSNWPSKLGIHASDDGTAELHIHRHSATAGRGATFYGARSRGTEASETAVQSADNLLDIISVGHDGTDYDISSRIDMEVDGTVASNQIPGRIKFSTANSSGTITEAMRIDSGQNLLLGGMASETGSTKTLLIANGIAPDNGVTDSVIFYSSDDAAGHTIPSFYCEGTNVVATGQADSASSVRIKVRINGTVYSLLAI